MVTGPDSHGSVDNDGRWLVVDAYHVDEDGRWRTASVSLRRHPRRYREVVSRRLVAVVDVSQGHGRQLIDEERH